MRCTFRSYSKWIKNFHNQGFYVFFLGILITLLLLICIFAYLSDLTSNSGKSFNPFLSFYNNYNDEGDDGVPNSKYYPPFEIISLEKASSRKISRKSQTQQDLSMSKYLKCNMYNCFDLYKCGKVGLDILTIYIYPIEKMHFDDDDEPIQSEFSKEFYQIIEAIRKSPYYISDPNKACIFVPTIDLLNMNQFSSINDVQLALKSLEFWGNDGQNHLLFTMFPENSLLLEISQKVIVSSTGFQTSKYRQGFHLPLIPYNPFLKNDLNTNNNNEKRHSNTDTNTHDDNHVRIKKILAISAQGNVHQNLLQHQDILILDFCSHDSNNYLIRCKNNKVYQYPQVFELTDFCLVLRELSHPILWDILSFDCIPVIVSDLQRLPFDEVIDWKRNAILLYENQLKDLSSILRSVSSQRKKRLKSQINFTFNKYFKSISHITNTVLEVIKERVYIHSAKPMSDWNNNPHDVLNKTPIFNSISTQKGANGFTAVILAYERIQSLFEVIACLSKVPSLSKIIVIWNNQIKSPPHVRTFPKSTKPIKIIQTKENKMSNRFYPYSEIQTEAVFSLDDDITMLTTDEIEFGFQVWKEFPDRIIGFPSRSHVWDNSSSRYKYESEWTNDISMVLTGAAFYHKYWHHVYTNKMPREIHDWVDRKKNCEDIAMNFLVAHETRKAPMKVTPRKKFKCPTCVNTEMLSSDSSHMIERTECINKFSQIYGYMPLISAEYRVDPVLYKVDISSRLKKYNDIGSL